MSLRFFADQCVSEAIVKSLQKEGHKVYVLRDCMDTKSLLSARI